MEEGLEGKSSGIGAGRPAPREQEQSARPRGQPCGQDPAEMGESGFTSER